MDSHEGTWALSPADRTDQIFQSVAPVNVVVTIRKLVAWGNGNFEVKVNGNPTANGTMALHEGSRTFHLTAVNRVVVEVVYPAGIGAATGSYSGGYQISVL
jgi:hypothetical protein